MSEARRTSDPENPQTPPTPGPAQTPLTEQDADTLLDVAEASVSAGLLRGRALDPDLAGLSLSLTSHGASFVTLERGGALLGCIGSLQAVRPLISDVASNAYAAGFVDPRLPAVTIEDYVEMDIEISVLSAPRPMRAACVEDVLAALQPGADGVVVEAPGHRATFLPAVWRSLPEPRLFIAQLWRKAWLTPGEWPEGTVVWRYRVTEIVRPGPRRPPSC